ncbi:MAG: HEAT repeat domain-containing protein [Candidatus Hodarchaeales archaeon]|jgi:HEAT repeat protein
MESKQPDDVSSSISIPPSFTTDFLNAFISTIFTIILWAIFLSWYPRLSGFLHLFGGISLGTIGGTLIVFFFTYSLIVRWLEIWAYRLASWRSGIPYMNYRTKCPFFQRSWLTFSCRAEQITPLKLEIIEKCHQEVMWEACWPERIPSILEVYDEAPVKTKQHFAFILAAMKEHALPAGEKMHEALTNDTLELEARVSAGYALEEMKNESGIEPLIAMVGQFDQRIDKMIRAILVRYKDMAVPHLISAVQNCDNDVKCGGFVDVMGKIKHSNFVPTLDNLLTDDTTGDFTRLQTIYALQEIATEDAFRILITYLERAPNEEQITIKEVCLSRKLISLPLLIDLLSNSEITEEYYALVGDILAEVDANTYDRFFTKLGELRGIETVQRLATILKENTPDEEEFLRIHNVLSKHMDNSTSLPNLSD